MELQYLADFSMIAKCGNFSLAADELFISQASLSKHIKSLELELGVPLFVRTTRSVHLSDYGRILLPFAQEVSARFDAMQLQLQKEKENRRSSLKIASIPVMAQYGITEALYAFRTEHPDIQLSVSEQEGSRIDDLLEKENFDLAFKRIAAGSEEESSYEEVIYCTDSLVAILPEGHPLSSQCIISLSDLKEDAFLLLDENTMIYHICMRACRSAGFLPKTAYKGHRPENILGLVAQGMGVSLLMKRQAAFYKNPGIVTVALEESPTSRISLVYKRNRALSSSAQSFVAFLRKYISEAQKNTENKQSL